MRTVHLTTAMACFFVTVGALAQTSSRARLQNSASTSSSGDGGADTCSGDLCQIGPSGISTDGGVVITGQNLNFASTATATTGVGLSYGSGGQLSLNKGGASAFLVNTVGVLAGGDSASATLTLNAATGSKLEWGSTSILCDGTRCTLTGPVRAATEYVAFSVSPNALLAATALGGAIVGPQAFTVTGISPFVATQAVTTAATLIFTITDGTNTCTGTFTCDGTGIASLQGTGPKRVTTANGAGTGCVYAASSALTLSVTTQGCGTAPIVNNITVVGKWQ